MNAIRGRSPNFLALLVTCVALGGCASSNRWDPHSPRNVVASADGGAITVQHGDRLRVPLVAEPKSGYEWRRVDDNYVLAAVAGGLIASVIMASSH